MDIWLIWIVDKLNHNPYGTKTLIMDGDSS